jgi:hypothetical protein
MGRKAREKWLRRVHAVESALLANSIQSKVPWYEGNLFLSVLATLVVAAMKQDLRWLLWVAWVFAYYPSWVISRNVAPLPRWKQSGLFLFSLAFVGSGLLGLNSLLEPTHAISAEQLCADARAFAQRLRDFDYERHKQLSDNERQILARMNQAKTEAEKLKILEEKSVAYSRWSDNFNYDLRDRYIPQGLYLRDQLLIRLPQQPVSTVMNDDATFRNIGPNAIFAAANRLDVLAHKLCPIDEKK